MSRPSSPRSKQREVDHEEHVPGPAVDAAEAGSQIGAQAREHRVRAHRLIGLEEEQAPRARAGRRGDRGAFGVGEELRDRRLPLAGGAHADPGQTLAAELLLDEALQPVDLAAGEPGRVVDRQAFHDPAGVHARAEGAKAAGAEGLAEIDELELDARIGAVAPEARHGVGVGEPLERTRQRDSGGLGAGARRQLLEHAQHVLDADEGHLEVHLRELELAVGALVLVAEAAHDLEVAVEAGNHQQLLHELRRLRQRVEAPGLQAARHQEVARALGRRLREHRRLDLEEPQLRERTPDRLVEVMAQPECALQRWPPQVVDAVAKPRRLVRIRLGFDGEGRRRRGVEQPKLADRDLDLTARELRVHRLGRASLDPAPHQDHVLGAQLARALMTLRGDIGAEDDLHQVAPPAQIDEDHTAVVATAVHPAAEHDLASHQRGVHLAAGVRAAQTAHLVEAGATLRHGAPRHPAEPVHRSLRPEGKQSEIARLVSRTRRALSNPERPQAPRSAAEQMQLRPSDLARYIALSARSSSASCSRPWVG